MNKTKKIIRRGIQRSSVWLTFGRMNRAKYTYRNNTRFVFYNVPPCTAISKLLVPMLKILYSVLFVRVCTGRLYYFDKKKSLKKKIRKLLLLCLLFLPMYLLCILCILFKKIPLRRAAHAHLRLTTPVFTNF